MQPASEEEIQQAREALMAYFGEFPLFRNMGFELLDVQPGKSVIRASHRDDLCQPAGVMHGGIIATLVDTGMAHSILLTEYNRRLHHGGGSIVSLDLRIKYFRPVPSGTIIATSTAPRLGSKIVHTESIVTNEQGKEVAKADAIFMGIAGMPVKVDRKAD
jgi:uncharacterized protein (TIGR00369 family)